MWYAVIYSGILYAYQAWGVHLVVGDVMSPLFINAVVLGGCLSVRVLTLFAPISSGSKGHMRGTMCSIVGSGPFGSRSVSPSCTIRRLGQLVWRRLGC